MLQVTLFISTILISALLVIAAFGRKKRSKASKIAFLLVGDMLLIVACFIYPFTKYGIAIPITTFSILNLFAIRKIFGPENPDQEILNAWHDDPANWKAGIFYYNPKDKRILPPKRIEGMGWTVNFANPYSIMVLLGILVLAVTVGYVFATNSSR
jgi:uncharacterized membrane protein